MLVVKKPNGNLRICIYPKDLNCAIKHEHYPMRTIEEVAANYQMQSASQSWMQKVDIGKLNLMNLVVNY